MTYRVTILARRLCWLLILVAGTVDLLFIVKDARNSWLISSYECQPPGCVTDFDGDGLSGTISFEAAPPTSGFPPRLAVVVVSDHGQELMRFPYRHADSTLRTHVAIYGESGKARLLIYDRINAEAAPPNGVFVWDGAKMSQVNAAGDDARILAAMQARDDTGTWNKWVNFRLLHIPLFIIFYLPLIGAIIWLRRHNPKRLRNINKKHPNDGPSVA